MKTWWIYLNQKANRWQCRVMPHLYSNGLMIEGQMAVILRSDAEEIINKLNQEIDSLKNKLSLHSGISHAPRQDYSSGTGY